PKRAVGVKVAVIEFDRDDAAVGDALGSNRSLGAAAREHGESDNCTDKRFGLHCMTNRTNSTKEMTSSTIAMEARTRTRFQRVPDTSANTNEGASSRSAAS